MWKVRFHQNGAPPVISPNAVCGQLRPTSGLPRIRPQQDAHRLLSVRCALGLDVLVKSQHVVWVVLFLDLHEASIVRPIARADQ